MLHLNHSNFKVEFVLKLVLINMICFDGRFNNKKENQDIILFFYLFSEYAINYWILTSTRDLFQKMFPLKIVYFCRERLTFRLRDKVILLFPKYLSIRLIGD